jgi:hypothetical protein
MSNESNQYVALTVEKLFDDWDILERNSKRAKPIQLARRFME